MRTKLIIMSLVGFGHYVVTFNLPSTLIAVVGVWMGLEVGAIIASLATGDWTHLDD